MSYDIRVWSKIATAGHGVGARFGIRQVEPEYSINTKRPYPDTWPFGSPRD